MEQGDSDSEDIICIVTFNLLVDPSVVESKMVLGLPYVTAITDLFKTYQTCLSPLVKCFTDSFKAVLLLWTNLFLSCFLVCSLQPCGHLLGRCKPVGRLVCDFCVFLSLSHVVSWVRRGT